MSSTSVETGARFFGRPDTGYPLIQLEDPDLASHAAALISQCLKRFGDYNTAIAQFGPNFLTAHPPIPADRVGAVATALCQGGLGRAKVQGKTGFTVVNAAPVPEMQPGYVDRNFDEPDGTGE
jgi:hypothetical protein